MLNAKGTLIVRLEAVTDKPTVCNLLHHSYFNLDDGGESDILDHQLKIEADAYMPVDEALIPDGRILPVKGTPYDFRDFRPIRFEEDGKQVEYDSNFCMTAARGPLRPCASVKVHNPAFDLMSRRQSRAYSFMLETQWPTLALV